MTSKQIVLTAATITGNKGAEAMLRSVIKNISKIYPNSKFVLLSYYVKKDRKLNKNKNLEILNGKPLYFLVLLTPLSFFYYILKKLHVPHGFLKINKVIRRLASTDLVIDLAGISFVDGREKYLLYNVPCAAVPLFMQKKIIKGSQAVGPFNGRINRYVAKLILPKLYKIFARGEETQKNLLSIGIKNSEVSTDLTFILDIDDDLRRKFKNEIKEKSKDKLIVGISPSSVIYKYCEKNEIDYVDTLVYFTNYLVDKGFYVVLVPHSIRKDTDKLKNNDLPIIKEIYENVKDKNNCLLIDEELNSEELRAVIATSDLFVASRFHAMISSLSEKVPTLVFGWSHKYKEILSLFELEDYCFNYTALDIEKLIAKFEFMEKNKEEIKEKLERNLPRVKELSAKQFIVIKNLLEI